jgi:hypothetical protein
VLVKNNYMLVVLSHLPSPGVVIVIPPTIHSAGSCSWGQVVCCSLLWMVLGQFLLLGIMFLSSSWEIRAVPHNCGALVLIFIVVGGWSFVCPPSSLSLLHPVFTPQAVAHGGSGGCWLLSVLWGWAGWSSPVYCFPVVSQSLSLHCSCYLPISTLRAAAHEAGEVVVLLVWHH